MHVRAHRYPDGPPKSNRDNGGDVAKADGGEQEAEGKRPEVQAADSIYIYIYFIG